MRAFLLLIASSALFAGSALSNSPASLGDVIREASGDASGVCVQLGCSDPALAASLAASGKLIVHALEPDGAKVQSARDALQKRGVYGQIAVEEWNSAVLPYGDGLVNLVLAENPGRIPDPEILRVLAPNGVAWVRRDNKWVALKKERPIAFDEWTHWRHGADGNMVSQDRAVAAPQGLRWVAGPAQDAGGKKFYYDHVLVSANGRNYYVYEDVITARDAYNGTLLWSRPVKAYSFKETGTEVPAFLQARFKQTSRTSKVRPVAVGDKLYVAAEGKLLALDGSSGQTSVELATVESPREVLVQDGRVIVSDKDAIRVHDAFSGSVIWQARINAERVVAGDGALFAMAGKTIVAFDLASGKEQWRKEDPEAEIATTVTYTRGVLVLESSSWRDDESGCGILVYSGKDGSRLWKKAFKPDMTHYKEARAFFARDLLWLQSGANKVIGYDPLTGEEKQAWTSRGKHCSSPLATERFFIAPECDFTDLETGERSRARMFKSACRLPFIPANGLLYTFPVQCECYPMLRGYMGLTSDTHPAITDAPALQRGPKFGRASAALAATDDDWPIYRRDVFRSARTSTPLKLGALKQSWKKQVVTPQRSGVAADWEGNPYVKGPVTPAVAVGNRVFVAVSDEHRVIALNASSGEIAWSFTAGGRIDSAPTIHEGLCLFGAHDGALYCLDAADGQLVWKLRVAPGESRIMAYGQMESVWPVPGSVLVDEGVAYVAAGRHPMSDGGVMVSAVKPRTGEIVWQKKVDDLTLTLSITNWYGPVISALTRRKVGLDFEPVDMFVKDGSKIAMSRWQFNPADGDYKLALASLTYDANGVEVPRGLWGYGIRQTKMVQPKPASAFDAAGVRQAGEAESAVLLVGDTLVVCSWEGDLRVGTQRFSLPSRPVHDGLIAARGRLFASLMDGTVLAFE